MRVNNRSLFTNYCVIDHLIQDILAEYFTYELIIRTVTMQRVTTCSQRKTYNLLCPLQNIITLNILAYSYRKLKKCVTVTACSNLSFKTSDSAVF